jgi:hypothetical protein
MSARTDACRAARVLWRLLVATIWLTGSGAVSAQPALVPAAREPSVPLSDRLGSHSRHVTAATGEAPEHLVQGPRYEQSPSPRQLSRAFYAVTVANLEESVQWYETHLGAEPVARSLGRAEIVMVANDYLMVELIHFADHAKGDTALVGSRAPGLKKAGAWLSPTVFDATLRRLQQLHAIFIGSVFADTAIQARSFIVKDASGTPVQFFTSSPR